MIKVKSKPKENANTVRKKTRWKDFRDNAELSALMIPGIVLLLVFAYVPMLGIIIAFKDYRNNLGIFKSKWVGFQNFKFFFESQDAWRIGRNTVGYGILFIVIGLIAAVTIAILLYEVHSRKALKFYQTSMILPHFLSWVIVGYITYILLEPSMGILNKIIRFFGGEGLQWYSEPKYWPFILVFVSAWKSVGYNCIVYLATLMGFDKSFYESAKIDGATRWQQIKYITLPLLRPTIIMLTMMAIGRIFYSDFGLFYQVPMNQGALYSTTNTIDTYVYRGLLQMGNVSMSAAAGVYQSIVGFILVLGANLLVRKIDRDSALI